MESKQVKLSFDEKFCESCGNVIKKKAVICPSCGVKIKGGSGGKSKIAAALLSLFLGVFGAHKFYLGKKLVGFIYLAWFVAAWSIFFVSAIMLAVSFGQAGYYGYEFSDDLLFNGLFSSGLTVVAWIAMMAQGVTVFVEFILFLVMSDEKFDEKYNNKE